MSNFTVKELKQQLKNMNLPVSGLKADLINRLQTNLSYQFYTKVQVNTDARTQERSRNLHKPLEDRRSGGAVSAPRRDEGTKRRTEYDRDRSERERDQPKTLRRCFNRDQYDRSKADYRTRYKDVNNKYYSKYSKRGHIASERYKKNEERRNNYARERPESGRPGSFRGIMQIETAPYCGQRGSHFPNVKWN